MKKEQGIVIILMSMILIICYFSPATTIDTFANILNHVENWKINPNLYEPGTGQSLNFPSLQTSFPYNKFMPERYNDNEIGLIKSDGIIVGGYMPQIVRPFDSVTANPSKESNCQWPCYSDKKFQQWCSEENAINYHAMRPLISPTQYIKNLKKMFKEIIDRNGPFKSPKGPDNDSYMAVFCTETQAFLMKWLMQKIALQVTKMPEMQRNGPWKYEMFYDTDVNIYQFVNPDSSTYFKIIFNLYNPLRSTSSMVYATIYMTKNEPSLIDMDFINNQSMEDYMAPQNGFGPITGYNINETFGSAGGGMGIALPQPIGFPNTPEGQKMQNDYYLKNPNEFDWNYKNTLEVQKFNKDGFYSNVPSDNIEIEGGVPESLKKALRESNCKEANLMSCVVPGYTGVLASPSAKSLNENDQAIDVKFAKLNGEIKNVYLNPSLMYTNKQPLSLRSVETVKGNIYI